MHNEAIEDDDLLAPQGLGADVGDDETDEFAGEWQLAHGFPDTRRAVRIWVDEETRRLCRVRLSTRWRDRLGTTRLEDAFAEAFFLANARVGEVPELAAPVIDPPAADPTLTWDDHPRISARIEELLERSDQLAARPVEEVRWADLRGEAVTATSAHGHVTVTLSLAGLTDSLKFDRPWLQHARMGEIAEAVLSAHEKAYARYQPPVFVPGEHEELADELAQARAALRTIMAKGL